MMQSWTENRNMQKKKIQEEISIVVVLGFLWEWQRDGKVKLSEGGKGMCEVSIGVCHPVLVPPLLTLLLLVLPSRLSARFWLITLSYSRLFPERHWIEVSSLCLLLTAPAWALPCPLYINQHTCTLLQVQAHPLPCDFHWRTGCWTSVSPPNPHLQMRHPTPWSRRETRY